MIARLLEDLFFLGRLGYFYRKSSKEITSLGFNAPAITRRDKARHAWTRAQFRQ